jgi:hypothetical protein
MTEFTVRSLADWDVLAARLLEYAGARRKFFLKYFVTKVPLCF